MSPPTAFVCGVTGTQGGMVAAQLRANNIPVHALARDTSSPGAVAAQALGVDLWQGDFDNLSAIEAAMRGCTLLFLNFRPDFTDTSADLRWARNLIAAAKAAGVKHAVFSSGLSVNAPEKLNAWNPDSLLAKFMLSKQAIERETREAGFEHWTVIRPGNFFSNYINPLVFMFPGLVDKGVTATAAKKDTVLPCIDPITIGKFVTAAFLDPAKFHGHNVEIADEPKTFDEILGGLSAATGRDLKAVYLSDQEIEAQVAASPFVQGQLASRNLIDFVDMDKVKSWGVPLSSFDAFLEREKDRVAETYRVSS
ncbi:hypothetical protein S40285_01392 [Stachybotrys chlorohalonatus IBT 40285]|uniref:NmrA-like domain-containing protein n=1 Tax=Stachybotrys chlorohalonatus (strain IBT 40285) TaxID=1283841 RepID=A0A084QLC0_STAC4|nr:hypothetical protein S40285_01392 [Stachybotrys chlorohalonata IBT 40285]